MLYSTDNSSHKSEANSNQHNNTSSAEEPAGATTPIIRAGISSSTLQLHLQQGKLALPATSSTPSLSGGQPCAPPCSNPETTKEPQPPGQGQGPGADPGVCAVPELDWHSH